MRDHATYYSPFIGDCIVCTVWCVSSAWRSTRMGLPMPGTRKFFFYLCFFGLLCGFVAQVIYRINIAKGNIHLLLTDRYICFRRGHHLLNSYKKRQQLHLSFEFRKANVIHFPTLPSAQVSSQVSTMRLQKLTILTETAW